MEKKGFARSHIAELPESYFMMIRLEISFDKQEICAMSILHIQRLTFYIYHANFVSSPLLLLRSTYLYIYYFQRIPIVKVA